MSRKPKKGYFVRGHFVAEGSELDQELKRELKGGIDISKTDLKRESEEAQALGEALLTLRADLLARLQLPDNLLDALAESKRITNFEGRRRQMQYIGKLMRKLDDDTINAARLALDEQAHGSVAENALLHEAESWRERMIAGDEAVGAWIETHAATDVQQLRALVRQARKDLQTGKPGEAPRQGKAFRELFQVLRAQLSAHGDADHGAMAADASREEDA